MGHSGLRGSALNRAAVAFAFFSVSAAHAYTPTLSANGLSVRWSGAVAKLTLAGNPVNKSGIDASAFSSAVVRSFQRWKEASGGSVDFDYYQGTDAGAFLSNSEYNGLSSIYFASNAKTPQNLDANVLGLTQVWYNTDNGEILETDIVLNDVSYLFTTNPKDTTGYGTSAGTSGLRRSFIENVLTHELGHALGLSHSAGLQSSMLFMESPEQAHLGCDEQVGIHAMYAARSDANVRGSIWGVVRGPSGGGVFGAQVVAVSRRRGVALASAMTDRNGAYRISGLEPGAYFVMAEPFYAGAQVLPAYYTSSDTKICNGQPFGRTVLMADGFTPQTLEVAAGQQLQAPDLAAKCGSRAGAVIGDSSASSNLATAPMVYDGSPGTGGFGVVDRYSGEEVVYYRLSKVSGHLELHAVAYSLYSPINAVLKLIDTSGNTVSARVAEKVYSGDSGYINYDSALVADNLPLGDYYLEVSVRSLNASLYPAGPVAIDSVPFVVITGSMNEAAPSLASVLPENGRCRMDESFPAYRIPTGPPPKKAVEKKDDGGSGVGFCGTVSAMTGKGPGAGSGPGAGAIAGWFFPFLFAAAVRRLMRASRAASAMA